MLSSSGLESDDEEYLLSSFKFFNPKNFMFDFCFTWMTFESNDFRKIVISIYIGIAKRDGDSP